MSMLDNNQWRLGHRRPWWQWNVLTLFAALFVLVWARELFGITSGVIWLLCSLIVFLWLVVPIGSMAPAPWPPPIKSQQADSDANDDSEDELASPRKSSAARALKWLVVAILIIKLLSSIKLF